MKKVTSLLMAAVIGCSAVPMCASAADTEIDYMVYDLNLDGKFDTRDVIDVNSIYAAVQLQSTPQDMFGFSNEFVSNIYANGDIVEDGSIDIMDAQKIMALLVECYGWGDTNCDSIIDSRDASLVLKTYTIGQMQGDYQYNESYNQNWLGDMNGDGALDARDATAILTAFAESQLG